MWLCWYDKRKSVVGGQAYWSGRQDTRQDTSLKERQTWALKMGPSKWLPEKSFQEAKATETEREVKKQTAARNDVGGPAAQHQLRAEEPSTHTEQISPFNPHNHVIPCVHEMVFLRVDEETGSEESSNLPPFRISIGTRVYFLPVMEGLK